MVYAQNRVKSMAAPASNQSASQEACETAVAAEAELVRAEKELEDCTICAPMDDGIDRANIPEGAHISTRVPLDIVVQTNPAHACFSPGRPHRSRRYRLPLQA